MPRRQPDDEALQHQFADLGQQQDASVFGMWVFLAQEILFFGGLFTAYAIYRHAYPGAFAAGSHHLSWQIGFANTLVLIASQPDDGRVLGGGRQEEADRRASCSRPVLLGSVFLGVKYLEYSEKIGPCRGDGPYAGCLVPGDRFDAGTVHLEGAEGRHAQIFFSLYYAMTGLHALHMIIGIPIILGVAALAWRGRFSPEYHTPVEIVGLYWHFVDIVWIFLFPLLYLIGKH